MKLRPLQMLTPLGGRAGALCLGAALLVVIAGCSRRAEQEASQIELVSGDHQVGLPGDVVEPLSVRVLGPRQMDFLGRKRRRQPVRGINVVFDVVRKKAKSDDGGDARPTGDPEGLADHPVLYAPDLSATAADTEEVPERKVPSSAPGRLQVIVPTNELGQAFAYVRLGAVTGDWRVEASIFDPDSGDKKGDVHFHLINGVKRVYTTDEAPIGGKLPIRLRFMHWDAESKQLVPTNGRDVNFRLASEPRGAEGTADLRNRRDRTRDGYRESELTLGDQPGAYRVVADVVPSADDRRPWPGIILTFVATDWLQVALTLLVGILTYVIGVRLLGSGFLLLSSRYMHLPTGPWSQNRLHGYFGGVLAAATFQSSSLVSNHLSSLANGGLLSAAGALGLVLGANLGATVLPQLLALDIGVFAAPLLGVGILLFLAKRRTTLRSWSWVLVGGGLVLTGWIALNHVVQLAAMSDGLSAGFMVLNEASVTSFAQLFFEAALIAFVFRSSNLLVVLSMLFAAHGLLKVHATVPIILGANFGSAVMVLSSHLTKRVEARRLALMNLIVQTLSCAGACVLVLIPVDGRPLFLWLVDWMAPGSILGRDPTSAARHVASVHTFYNLASGVVFLALPQLVFRVLDRLIPCVPGEEEVKPYHLDENLVEMPALALRQATEEVVYSTKLCRKTIAEAFDSFRYGDLDLSEQVVRREEVLTGTHREVSRYLLDVAHSELSHRDASQMEILQSAVQALARIGQLAETLRELASRKIDERIAPAEEVERDLNEVYDLVMSQFDNILTLLKRRDSRTEENAVKMVERLAKYSSRIDAHWRQRIEQADTARPSGSEAEDQHLATHLQTLVYHEAFILLFRVAADLAHIAQRIRILWPDRD